MHKEQKKREYKISYAKCKKGGMHNQEPLNIVCLEDSCCDHRLICSICKTEDHAQHKTQPLKFYIDSLSTAFTEDNGDVRQKLNEMEEKRNEILVTLQETVTNISQKFRDLEAQIINRFKIAKERILEEDAMKKGFQNIYQILSTPNHPDLGPMITKYTKIPPPPNYPNPQRLVALQSAVNQQIVSAISFYKDETAKIGITNSVKVLYPAGIVFDGETIEQIPNNTMNLCLLNEPITTENHKVKIKILSDNPKIAMGIITMAQFKKYAFTFDPAKATSSFVCWISSDGKGANYNSNTISGFAKEDVFDMALKKGQLIINKKKSKQYASLLAKDLGVDYYFFWALLGPGKIQLLEKGYKK